MKKTFHPVRKVFICLLLSPSLLFAFSVDSLFEPFFRHFDLLPDYYQRLNLSTFAFHHDAFLKRQYLAEPHPDLEFRLISYNNLISSVWNVDFQFGLGEVPGNNIFTVLNVAFGIDPKIEVKLRHMVIAAGLAHHCYHEIDDSFFPLVYHNRLHCGAMSPNARLNDYFHSLYGDSCFQFKNRFSWQVEAGYYLKEFFGLVGTDKLNGSSPLIAELSSTGRYAIHRRRSWIFSLRGETTLGLFDNGCGYHVKSNGKVYWKQALGTEAYFMRGNRGSSLFLLYHLDDLPVPPDAPKFTLGNSRFSKNGLLQIGVVFFN